MSESNMRADIEAEFDAAGISVADWADYARQLVRFAARWVSTIGEAELQAADPDDVAKLVEHARRVANLRSH
jgi:hypothetical protein